MNLSIHSLYVAGPSGMLREVQIPSLISDNFRETQRHEIRFSPSVGENRLDANDKHELISVKKFKFKYQ